MQEFNLDKKLLQLSEDTFWTARNAVEGVQIFGGIGSGKTSGSGKTLALSYLKAGFGGLVLTVKPEERKLWEEEYCEMTGRKDDLIIIGPDDENTFNFLAYEGQGGMTDNIMQILKTVIRAGEDKSNGGSDDQFWQDALDMLLFNVIDLCKLAYGKVEIQTMYDIVQTVPNVAKPSSDKETDYSRAYELARENVAEQIREWRKGLSIQEQVDVTRSESALDLLACRDLADARTFRFIKQFFTETYVTLSDKTRSIIDFSFSSFLFRLLRDPVYSLFCTGISTFRPEDCEKGKIILIDLPVKLFHKVGQDAQIMFKYIWQRAMEQRKIQDDTLPVFLWADEAQNFLHEYDADYQATARSSRIATVYISQNLPNYYANMGGAKSDFRVKSFLGTLATKFFHANADVETNKYASDLIGDAPFVYTSKSITHSEKGQFGRNSSMKFERAVRPEAFSTLRTGGRANGFQAECFAHVQSSMPNHFKMSFDQNITI